MPRYPETECLVPVYPCLNTTMNGYLDGFDSEDPEAGSISVQAEIAPFLPVFPAAAKLRCLDLQGT
jgi:hypothetical protein